MNLQRIKFYLAMMLSLLLISKNVLALDECQRSLVVDNVTFSPTLIVAASSDSDLYDASKVKLIPCIDIIKDILNFSSTELSIGGLVKPVIFEFNSPREKGFLIKEMFEIFHHAAMRKFKLKISDDKKMIKAVSAKYSSIDLD
jgi:hypothetical protein